MESQTSKVPTGELGQSNFVVRYKHIAKYAFSLERELAGFADRTKSIKVQKHKHVFMFW